MDQKLNSYYIEWLLYVHSLKIIQIHFHTYEMNMYNDNNEVNTLYVIEICDSLVLFLHFYDLFISSSIS